jgi:hypothetical protein
MVTQFFSESLVVAGLAFCLAILAVQISLPWFNQVAGKNMAIMWTDPVFW